MAVSVPSFFDFSELVQKSALSISNNDSFYAVDHLSTSLTALIRSLKKVLNSPLIGDYCNNEHTETEVPRTVPIYATSRYHAGRPLHNLSGISEKSKNTKALRTVRS